MSFALRRSRNLLSQLQCRVEIVDFHDFSWEKQLQKLFLNGKHKKTFFMAIGSYLKMYQIKYNVQRNSLHGRKPAHKKFTDQIFNIAHYRLPSPMLWVQSSQRFQNDGEIQGKNRKNHEKMFPKLIYINPRCH